MVLVLLRRMTGGEASWSSSSSSNQLLWNNAVHRRPIHNTVSSGRGGSTNHHHHYQRTARVQRNQKEFFTPSPFARSSRINLNDQFAIVRQLIEGKDHVYGIRKYLLMVRSEEEDANYYANKGHYSPTTSNAHIVASLNANRNVLFGAKLHTTTSSTTADALSISSSLTESSNTDQHRKDNDILLSSDQFLAACGPLVDVAKIDASINGQQVQALATLNGLCDWVKECLERHGEGSKVLKGLMYGESLPLTTTSDGLINDDDDEYDGEKNTKEEEEITKEKKLLSSSRSCGDTRSSSSNSGKRAKQRIETHHDPHTLFALQDASDRLRILEAIRAIATGHPRPGHSVVGAGTYRDGRKGWTALAREYCRLAIRSNSNNAMSLGTPYSVRWKGLEEVALYKSKDGEVTAIEHLAHTQPEYLREAGGAMARIFFV